MKAIFVLFISVALAVISQAGAPIKDLRVSGTSSVEGGTFTFASGVTITAASGSTVDLSGGTLTLATNQVGWVKVSKTGSSLVDLATRSASDLSSGTLPDARFPATLPAMSGVNLTALNGSNLGSGTIAIARGGTGIGTAPTAGQILIGQTGGTYVPATITAGSNITVTNTSGVITIASTGGGALSGLSDVTITSPANNQVLTYQSSSSKWINSSSAGGGLSDPTTTKGDLLVNNGSTVTRLAVGTNTFVLTADSTAATGVKWAATSASIPSWVTNHANTPPTSANAKDDEFTSSATLPGGGSAIWTALNGTNNALSIVRSDFLKIVTTASTSTQSGIYQTLPTAPWTITAKVSGSALFANAMQWGIILRESSSGKLRVWQMGNTGIFIHQYWSSPTVAATNVFNSGNTFSIPQVVYLRIVNDSTNFTMQYSVDGVLYTTLSTVGVTVSLTPDQFGIAQYTSVAAITGAYDFIRVTQP